ncbi:hypothetical protein ACFX2I_013788 [Malus domestica]
MKCIQFMPQLRRDDRYFYLAIVCSIIGIVVCFFAIFGSVYAVLWKSFYPHGPQITVTNASLTRLDSAAYAENTLDYNLALNFTIRNRNKGVRIDYRSIQVIGADKNYKSVAVSMAPFYQEGKSTTVMHALLQLQGKPREMAGVYSIDVMFFLRVRYDRVKLFRKIKGSPQIRCKLQVRLSSSNGTSAGGFNPTECKNVPGNQRYRIRAG